MPTGTNASDIQKFPSDIDWKDFVLEVAETMGVRRLEVNLSYRFSSFTAKQRSLILNKPYHLAGLFGTAAPLLEAAREKSKSFRVILEDQNALAAKNSGNSKDSRGDNKKRSGGKLATVSYITIVTLP